ncbi:MAG: sigma-54 dependent transcriptional regulator, partial [Candidatus Hydrogenedentes bacterium]|nr:sigma-54 dependent transcriptional regulator [Candidatus Hydrogenedentota bacterium]
MTTAQSKHRILVVDDEPLMREYVEEALLRAGYLVDTAGNGADGVALFEAYQHDVVVTDLKMTPMDGLGVLKNVLERHPETQVIVMTAYGTIETAVSALKGGATDYILKPFAPDALELAVTRALELARLTQENRYLREELNTRYDNGAMVGGSSAMQQVQNDIAKVVDSRATVLIRGASGTGKELVARAIHHGGMRANKPFIKVNCAALSAGILESELFGHEKGAFTGAHDRKIGRFELADGGTLLLDEVSEIDVGLQAKLLRALQDGEVRRVGESRAFAVDVRVISATHRDLARRVSEGHFREDLYYRLRVVQIPMPPLRKRREDIPLLIEHFVSLYNQRFNRKMQGVDAAAVKQMTRYDWPGNIRELQHAVEHAFVMCREETIGLEHLPPELQETDGDCLSATGSMENDAPRIMAALEKSGGNQS